MEICKLIPLITDLSISYKTDITDITSKLKNGTIIDNEFNYDIENIYKIYNDITSIQLSILQIDKFKLYLSQLKYKRTKLVPNPSKITINKIIKNAAEKI